MSRLQHWCFRLVVVLVLGMAGLSEAVGPRVRRGCKIAWDAVTTCTDASSCTPTGYRVYTTTTSGNYGTPTLEVGSGILEVTCRALGTIAHNQQYYARITAYDGNGESAPSAEVPYVTTMGAAMFR